MLIIKFHKIQNLNVRALPSPYPNSTCPRLTVNNLICILPDIFSMHIQTYLNTSVYLIKVFNVCFTYVPVVFVYFAVFICLFRKEE